MNTFAFHTSEIPAAHSMLRLAHRLDSPDYNSEIIPQFMCTWVSFNNIYNNLWLKCRQIEQVAVLATGPNPQQDPTCPLKPSLVLVDRKVDEDSLLEHA